MNLPPIFNRGFAAAALLTANLVVAEPPRLVLQNGRSVPITSVSFQGGQFAVTTTGEFFTQGQTIPFASVDHVFGDKPAETNRGIAVMLIGKPSDAIKILEPVVAANKITAKIPGNFWIEPAKALALAYALNADTAKCNELGKEISDATPAPGIDPFVPLSRTLLLPKSTSTENLEEAFRESTSDSLPADVCAYASFFRARVLREAKKNPEALEAYLTVPGLYPAGSMIINAAAEMYAAELLTELNRREEAVALLQSALRGAGDTVIANDVHKRLESLK